MAGFLGGFGFLGDGNSLSRDTPSVSKPVKQAMLHRAEDLINGQRQQDYGDKLRNFQQIADFWNAHLRYKLADGQRVSAEDVALMMINVKQARLAKSPAHRDSILDVAGYAGCYDKILDERESGNVAVNPGDRKDGQS